MTLIQIVIKLKVKLIAKIKKYILLIVIAIIRYYQKMFKLTLIVTNKDIYK